MNYLNFSQEKAVLDFYGNGCLNCQIMEPIIKKLEQSIPQVHFYHINADIYPNLIQKYQITSLPTLLLLNNGKILSTIIGVKSLQNLRQQINTILLNS